VELILEKLQLIISDQEEIRRQLRQVAATDSPTTTLREDHKYPPLPLKDKDELKATEDIIQDAVQYQKLVSASSFHKVM